MTHAAPPQRRIGLTGGIATGKSTVAKLLSEGFGLPVLDADQFAREALAPDSPAARVVLERYGDRVRSADPGRAASHQGAAIDRAALGRIVFADAAERRWLEGVVHPLVRQRFASDLERLAAAPAVVLMIPLLFEAGLEGLCTEIWLVDCPEAEQVRRLRSRDGLGEVEARARLAAQWPQQRKRALADVVIENGDGQEPLADRLARALNPSASR
jgi:dephospho-CoA kinase